MRNDSLVDPRHDAADFEASPAPRETGGPSPSHQLGGEGRYPPSDHDDDEEQRATIQRSTHNPTDAGHQTTVPRILVTRPLPDAGFQQLDRMSSQGLIHLTIQPTDEPANRQWLLNELKRTQYNAIICMLGDKIDDQLLEAAGSQLECVSTMSAGYDHIDIVSLKQRGIRLGTTPDALTDATADVGAMLTLMATRRAGEGMRAVIDGQWPMMPWAPLLLCGHGLQGRTIGILGFGKIGQLTLKRLLGFDIGRALYVTSKPNCEPKHDYFNLVNNTTSSIVNSKGQPISIEPATSLKQLAQESDVLIVCCALTHETRHVVSTEFLNWMKPTSYLVNTSRGPVVDTRALIQAIDEGKLAGAGLDVVEGEPNIQQDDDVVKQSKIVVLPHVGSATIETRNDMARQCVVNCFAGVGLRGYEWINEVML
ncbi:hypothetical protein OIO90_006389 [Microbotryomycetes sp. JL221]|nr:hypothetical protein OIO90_006389 [Microbotryomycetes sp. JL221]